MAVPAFTQFFPVVFRALADTQGPLSHRELRQRCIETFHLTQDEIAETIASGQSRLANRVYWAVSYCRMAGLLENAARGYVQLTEDGRRFYAEHGDGITLAMVKECPRFVEHQEASSSESDADESSESSSTITPEERIAEAVAEYNATLSSELLQEINDNLTDDDFEKLCVMLLIKMGYGRPELNRDSVTPHSGDGGIDGVVRGDPLGFDSIYLQAKKYAENVPVSPNLIREFIGAMSGKRNGAFITTSRFTSGAVEAAQRAVDKHLVLIDGPKLLKYMIEYGLGVQTIATHAIKKVDAEFFRDEF